MIRKPRMALMCRGSGSTSRPSIGPLRSVPGNTRFQAQLSVTCVRPSCHRCMKCAHVSVSAERGGASGGRLSLGLDLLLPFLLVGVAAALDVTVAHGNGMAFGE